MLFALACCVAAAQDPGITPQFVTEAMVGRDPIPATIWITGSRAQRVEQILGHRSKVARIRYWRSGTRCAFVLDEVAHTEPITAGFVVQDGVLIAARVLVYRESRGAEVRNEGFLDRLVGSRLDAELGLDRSVDGITGATLSVSAMTRMARLALYLAMEASHDGG